MTLQMLETAEGMSGMWNEVRLNSKLAKFFFKKRKRKPTLAVEIFPFHQRYGRLKIKKKNSKCIMN